MRLTKAATVGIVVAAFVITAGTGFAAFTSSAYINGTATAGTLGPLTWGLAPGHGGTGANDICSASRGTGSTRLDTIYLTAGNLAPGDACTYGDSLANHGSIPADVQEHVTSATGGLCGDLYFQDNFFSPSVLIGSGGQASPHTNVIDANHWFKWAGQIYLSWTAGNSYSGESCSFDLTLSATAGT